MTNKFYYRLFYFTLVIFITACNFSKKEYYNDGTLKSEYYSSNNLKDGIAKEYNKNGNLIIIHSFKQGKLVDTSTFYRNDGSIKMKNIWIDSSYHREMQYDKSGTIESVGNVNNDDLKIGEWSFFKDGKLDFIREYKIIKGKQHLNQQWKLNEKGDTLYKESKYFRIQVLQDTIKKGEAFLAAAYLQSHFFKGKPSEILVCVPAKEDENFTKDFSNERQIKLDTFYNIQHDLKNQKNFEGHSKPYSAAFGKWFKNTIGKKNIRGFIEEYYKENDTVTLTKMYFDIPIYVREN